MSYMIEDKDILYEELSLARNGLLSDWKRNDLGELGIVNKQACTVTDA